jgi:hypothetical protein
VVEALLTLKKNGVFSNALYNIDLFLLFHSLNS